MKKSVDTWIRHENSEVFNKENIEQDIQNEGRRWRFYRLKDDMRISVTGSLCDESRTKTEDNNDKGMKM